MSQTVKDKLLQRCKTAVLSGTPIVYIKTESPFLIEALVFEEKKPIVSLICNTSFGVEYQGRPIGQAKQDGKCMKSTGIKNYAPNLPDEKNYTTCDHPCIWTYCVPQKEDEAKNGFKILEKYIANHQNPDFSNYHVLQSSIVILYGKQVVLSPMLQQYTEIIEVEYPDEQEIRNILLTESLGDPALTQNEEYLSALCNSFLGFSSEEILIVIRGILATIPLNNTKLVKARIAQRKKQRLEGGVLEYCKVREKSIGGMKHFCSWLTEQQDALQKSALYHRKHGAPPPKGVLLCGIPGCGKSEAAHFTAQTLQLPLLKMDVGSLMDKFQGESEEKMRNALKLAQAMSPCVLWIDELEKAFSGSTSENSDSFKRMFGYMLGWMQDNKKPCFIFATANNIGQLPKEFFRSGRFDALYAVYLPTANECVGIFRACMDNACETISRLQHIPAQEVQLFEKSCYSQKALMNLVNTLFVKPNGMPRMVIGSDISQMVTTALRSLPVDHVIQQQEWLCALKAACEKMRLYGDGEENIDSIACSYCRMLRKGFLPTADKVLFDATDYHGENFSQLKKLQDTPTYHLTEEKQRELEKQQEQYVILTPRDKTFDAKYDQAVYKALLHRINQLAIDVETKERLNLIET